MPGTSLVLAQEPLQRLERPRHHAVVQALLLQPVQPLRQAETRIGPHHAQPDEGRQVVEQIQREGHDVAGATAVARAPPKPGDQLGLGQHRQERRQTRLEAQPRVPRGHALLMAALVQEPGRIQIQRVAARPGTEPLQPPAPERTEGGEILARRSEALEEAAEGRLAGDVA